MAERRADQRPQSCGCPARIRGDLAREAELCCYRCWREPVDVTKGNRIPGDVDGGGRLRRGFAGGDAGTVRRTFSIMVGDMARKGLRPGPGGLAGGSRDYAGGAASG